MYTPGKNKFPSVFLGYCYRKNIFFKKERHIRKAREILHLRVYLYFCWDDYIKKLFQ